MSNRSSLGTVLLLVGLVLLALGTIGFCTGNGALCVIPSVLLMMLIAAVVWFGSN